MNICIFPLQSRIYDTDKLIHILEQIPCQKNTLSNKYPLAKIVDRIKAFFLITNFLTSSLELIPCNYFINFYLSTRKKYK